MNGCITVLSLLNIFHRWTTEWIYIIRAVYIFHMYGHPFIWWLEKKLIILGQDLMKLLSWIMCLYPLLPLLSLLSLKPCILSSQFFLLLPLISSPLLPIFLYWSFSAFLPSSFLFSLTSNSLLLSPSHFSSSVFPNFLFTAHFLPHLLCLLLLPLLLLAPFPSLYSSYILSSLRASFHVSHVPLTSHHLYFAWFWPFSPIPPVCLLPLSQRAILPARLAPAPPRPTAPPAPRWPPYRAAIAGWAAKRGISSTLSLESASVSQPLCINVCLCAWVRWWCHAQLYAICMKLSSNTLPWVLLSGPSGNRATNSSRVHALLCPLRFARSHRKRHNKSCVCL